jgi:hypothetical protein
MDNHQVIVMHGKDAINMKNVRCYEALMGQVRLLRGISFTIRMTYNFLPITDQASFSRVIGPVQRAGAVPMI